MMWITWLLWFLDNILPDNELLTRGASPEGDIDDADFIDLLLEYDHLKKELHRLENEDEKVDASKKTKQFTEKPKDKEAVP